MNYLNYGLSFTLNEKKDLTKGTVQKTKANTVAEIKNYSENKLDTTAGKLEQKSGALKYSEIFNNVDIEYKVSGYSLKENIIINSKQKDNVYSFTLNTKYLNLILQESGDIIGYDSLKSFCV